MEILNAADRWKEDYLAKISFAKKLFMQTLLAKHKKITRILKTVSSEMSYVLWFHNNCDVDSDLLANLPTRDFITDHLR